VSGWIGDKNDAQAVYWYGIYSLIVGWGSALLWNELKSKSYAALYYEGFVSRFFAYIPVGMCWIMISLFDSPFTRTVFKDLVSLSVMGPFFGHWYAWGLYLLNLENEPSLDYYLAGGVWFAWTIFEEIVQIVLLPQVFDWIDSAATVENDE